MCGSATGSALLKSHSTVSQGRWHLLFRGQLQKKKIIVYKKIIDKTTILVSQVFSMCVIGPLNFKGAQLVPQVLKLSCINPFTNYISDITYVANETMI